MNRDDALRLARDIKFGPLPKPNDPMPSIDEAIELISEARKGCGFNWLTGAEAEEVLRNEKGNTK